MSVRVMDDTSLVLSSHTRRKGATSLVQAYDDTVRSDTKTSWDGRYGTFFKSISVHGKSVNYFLVLYVGIYKPVSLVVENSQSSN